MADQAQITSVEAIEAFRAELILYLSRARPALEEVSGEIVRARVWLQNDQRRFWENELRLRSKKLEQAQQELLNARLSSFQESTSLQQMAVNRWKRAVEEAEQKLAKLKKWDRELDSRAEPLVKQVEQLHNFLSGEMPKAIAHLAQTVKTLEAYADVAPPPPQSG